MSEWADENRILPRGSAEPGPWRTSRTPYMRAVMDAAIDPKYKRVVLVAGAQMSKTELLLNLIGYRMDIDPAPILFISASQRLAESESTSRLMPMIRSTPALLDKLDTSRSKLKITEKFIAGHRMAGDVDGEGDPVALAEARTATHADGKVVVVSTPTLEGASPIWDLYSGGTMSRWTWACPDCLTYFAPEFALLQWDPKATPQQAKRSARLACPHCGSLIEDKHRAKMNAGGRYEITGDADSDCASFHISGLASPWRTWGEAAKQARVITAGVDLQGDKLVYAVRAWGPKATSWLVHHGEIWGDTDQAEVWEQLAELVSADYGALKMRLMLVDSGFRPDRAYAFARRFPGRVQASKGHAGLAKPVNISKLEVDSRGKTSRHGVQLAHVDTRIIFLTVKCSTPRRDTCSESIRSRAQRLKPSLRRPARTALRCRQDRRFPLPTRAPASGRRAARAAG